jgi:small-conductance mechanosensitive channel
MDIFQLTNTNYFGNTGMQYIIAFAVLITTIIVMKLIKSILFHRLKILAKKTKNDIDDLVIEIIDGLNWPFIFGVSLYIALKFLQYNNLTKVILDKFFLILIVFYSVKVINEIVSYLTHKQVNKRDDDDDSLVNVLSNILKGFVWIVAFLLVLSNMGVNVTSLLAGLGVGGIAIAFALQRILEDIFSSFSIYFDKPFEVGDFIIVGDELGTVEKIGLKTTRIKHLKGQELVVSNRELTSTKIHNYKKMKKRRIAFSFGVEYGTTLAKLKKINKIVKSIIDKIDLAKIDRIHFKEFGDFSLNFEAVYYLDSREYGTYMDVQQKINFQMLKEFEKEKIEFAFPTQTIHIKGNKSN